MTGMSTPAFERRSVDRRAPANESTTVPLATSDHSVRNMRNAFSVDVEEHYQVEAFRGFIARNQWVRFESRVVVNTRRLLGLLQKRSVTATFFILGCVAERYPRLVRECIEAGHEIASHGWDHRPVTELTRDEFRSDVRRTKDLLEDLGGVEVLGYRAPTYSIVESTMWALEVLLEEGYRYDSSIFPIIHDRYGVPGAPRFPGTVATQSGSSLLEFPISTVRFGGINVPFIGGGYLRHLPQHFVHWGMRRVIERERQPVIVYVHPWELDPEQPRLGEVPAITRWRHYRNLERTEDRLESLFAEFSFGTVREVLGL
jgi:polysaccharide deacetylase family protein (PEP-CTERM system associated)